jgi:hypothetical protein
VTELTAAKQAEVHGFDDAGVFEGCMPVEVMARRGEDTLRYGPLKPVGLVDPRTGEEPYAVVQLRKDNAEGTIYNLVGFQTHLTWGEQKRVFSMIPALREAEFVRYGVMHRNTYLNSPGLLDRYYRLQKRAAGELCRADDRGGGLCGILRLRHAGGVETARGLLGLPPVDFPPGDGHRRAGALCVGGQRGRFPAHEREFRHHNAPGPQGEGQEKQKRGDLPQIAGDHRRIDEGRFWSMRLIIDAMGGDNAPEEIVKGA